MNVLGIDQSLSKCAIIHMVGNIVKDKHLLKTGNSKVKTKRKDTLYFECLHKQIHHISDGVIEYIGKYSPEVVAFEALSFGSAGDQSRNLACLFGGIRERIILEFPDLPIVEYAPTSLKSFAKDFLKPEDQVERDVNGNVVLLKSKKPKKVKMDKKMMVQAIKEHYGESYLSGYNYSTGLDDLADATFLALKVTKDYEENY